MKKGTSQTFELQKFITATLAGCKKNSRLHGIDLVIKDDLISFVMINGNRDKIRLLIDTVVQNTINYSKASKISFTTHQLLKSNTEILIEFLLEDNGKTGKNIKPFAYYRSLVTAKKLIEELDGKSELIISQNSGTTLRFIIKCAWNEINYSPNLCFGSGNSGLQSKNILVVEDNEINQKTITLILQEENVNFKLASNGKEAIDMLEKMPDCDLVIMDLDMPYMDGLEAAKYIRKKMKNDVPIIGMTSGEDGTEALKCLEAGMNQFIKKPFTSEQLVVQACSFFGPDILV